MTLSRPEPLHVSYGIGLPEADDEGRVITTEYERYYVVNAYVPNSGEGLKRLDFRVGQYDAAFRDHVKRLEQRKPVIMAGDFNCAHREIDIYDSSKRLLKAS